MIILLRCLFALIVGVAYGLFVGLFAAQQGYGWFGFLVLYTITAVLVVGLLIGFFIGIETIKKRCSNDMDK